MVKRPYANHNLTPLAELRQSLNSANVFTPSFVTPKQQTRVSEKLHSLKVNYLLFFLAFCFAISAIHFTFANADNKKQKICFTTI